MSRTLAWVLGGGGLLGSHLLAAIAAEGPGITRWNPGPSCIPWQDPVDALEALADQASRFALEVLSEPGEWMVLWCAGAGVIGSRSEELEAETTCLARLLALLAEKLPDRPGKVLLASSAGGVYGGNREQPLSEVSACMPVSDYGRNKLAQERLLLHWAQGMPRVSTLVARMSNLYGPGQHLEKPQGLIAHISRSILHHLPVHIYVPLDTQRDYLYVEDCARELLQGLRRLGSASRENVVKIFHSGESTTIAGLIGAFARIVKGHPRIICSASPVGAQQPLQLCFRSGVWPDLDRRRRTDLAVGIQRVHQHLLSRFQEGKLPPA